ncbi:uncharacterized protein LOC8026869 [Ixodes scapularis]|uniref:uncharacterized protein LOC8026869 n=1 Tax=Ixodes scapularis TaxID=6945 RepID=UPI001A9CFC55|nr:uncharacterized protein LOC8026869 [Ixodes scapularis]
MAVNVVLLATAGFSLLTSSAAASLAGSQSPTSRSRPGSVSRRSSSYTATGVRTDADTSHAIDANLHPAVLKTQRLHPQEDLGVSYIGEPPDSGEAISRAELFAMMLQKEQPRPPHRHSATRTITPRFKTQRWSAPSAKETSQRLPTRRPTSRAKLAPRARLSYVKTVSYIPFPYYGFGYGLHHYSPWMYYSPVGLGR